MISKRTYSSRYRRSKKLSNGGRVLTQYGLYFNDLKDGADMAKANMDLIFGVYEARAEKLEKAARPT